MKTIEYRAIYGSGVITTAAGSIQVTPSEEVIRVKARAINSGYSKALKVALQPLGSGAVRELTSLQFWQVL